MYICSFLSWPPFRCNQARPKAFVETDLVVNKGTDAADSPPFVTAHPAQPKRMPEHPPRLSFCVQYYHARTPVFFWSSPPIVDAVYRSCPVHVQAPRSTTHEVDVEPPLSLAFLSPAAYFSLRLVSISGSVSMNSADILGFF